MTVATERPQLRQKALTEPRIITMPDQRMAVVETFGDPNLVAKRAIPALYGAVYALKFAHRHQDQDFKIEPLRARWLGQPGQSAVLHGLWGLPVPAMTRSVTQKNPDMHVDVQTWPYGTVAEVLHLGPYSAERATVDRLLRFVHDEGYEIDGPHEEEYLSRPEARVPKTLIRYRIRKAQPWGTTR